MAKRQVFWIPDSGGRESVHENGVNLSMEASYLGHLERRGDQWVFVPRDGKPTEPNSYAQTKRGALKLLDAEYV